LKYPSKCILPPLWNLTIHVRRESAWRPTIPFISIVLGIQWVSQAMQRCAILIPPIDKNILYGGELWKFQVLSTCLLGLSLTKGRLRSKGQVKETPSADCCPR
jgi:hypothetical protein